MEFSGLVFDKKNYRKKRRKREFSCGIPQENSVEFHMKKAIITLMKLVNLKLIKDLQEKKERLVFGNTGIYWLGVSEPFHVYLVAKTLARKERVLLLWNKPIKTGTCLAMLKDGGENLFMLIPASFKEDFRQAKETVKELKPSVFIQLVSDEGSIFDEVVELPYEGITVILSSASVMPPNRISPVLEEVIMAYQQEDLMGFMSFPEQKMLGLFLVKDGFLEEVKEPVFEEG